MVLKAKLPPVSGRHRAIKAAVDRPGDAEALRIIYAELIGTSALEVIGAPVTVKLRPS